MGIILAICGVFWIFIALVGKTNDFWSALVFKVFTFFTGLANLLCAMDLWGWVNIFA